MRLDTRGSLRRRTDLSGYALRLTRRAVTGVLTGSVAAAVTLWLDRRAGLTLPFPTSNSQLLLGTLVGAMITVTVFVLWIRVIVVSLASGQASPRVLTGYLDDAFQRNLTAWMMAGLAYMMTVTVALPSHPPGGRGVPAVSSVLSLAVLLAGLGTVLVALHSATRSVSMPQVVRGLADRAFAVMATQELPNDPPPSTTPRGPMTTLRAPMMGWIQWTDYDAIIEVLPAETTLAIGLNVGDFVAEGDHLASADAELADDAAATIVDSFAIVPTRASEYDLAYAIQQLADVAEHAMTPSSLDTSTAYEALVHLRAVLDRLLRQGAPTGTLRGPDRRWIVAQRALTTADHLHTASQRLVTVGSQDPTSAEELRAMLNALEETARLVGDTASRKVLSEQRSRLEREARSTVASPTGDGA